MKKTEESKEEFKIGGMDALKFYRIVCNGILVSLVFVLFGSVSHLAYTFNTVEGQGSRVVGWIVALGIESGLMWIAFGMSEKRKNNDKSRMWLLTMFMFSFCVINFAGNYYYGISRFLENEQLLMLDFMKVDKMIHLKTFLLSGSLPLIALALIEIYAIFNQRKQLEGNRQKRDYKKKNVKKTDHVADVSKKVAISKPKKKKLVVKTAASQLTETIPVIEPRIELPPGFKSHPKELVTHHENEPSELEDKKKLEPDELNLEDL